MSDTIEPAMSAKEWAELIRDSTGEDAFREFPIRSDYGEEHYGKPHRIAAECLYLQSFGFTREDAKLCRGAYHDYVIFARHAQDSGDEETRLKFKEIAERFFHLADRIAALLPPEV
jgi:hypothetical protein